MHLDAIDRWVTTATGRNLDQHATDPIRTAAHLPEAAHTLRGARAELRLAVERLRTLFTDEEDLTGPVGTFTRQLATVNERAREYQRARNWIELLIESPTRIRYAAANPARPIRRLYVKPGDTVLVVLPSTDPCRMQRIVGQTARIQIGESDAVVELPDGGEQVRLKHTDAGIYHDPVTGGIYILQCTDEARVHADNSARRIAEALLTEVITRIHRRYPTADMAYVSHPGLADNDAGDDIVLWDLTAPSELLWPDKDDAVFQRDGDLFWLDDRDGDPYAELAEINRLLTAVYRQCGAELFEPGELGGGWYLPLNRA